MTRRTPAGRLSLLLICTAAVLFIFSAFSAVRASVPVFTRYGNLTSDRSVLTLSDGETSFIPDLSGTWSAFGDITGSDIRNISGISFYCADINTKNDSLTFSSGGCSFMFDLSGRFDVTGNCSSFFTGISLRGGNSLSKPYEIEIRIDTSTGSITLYTTVHAVSSPSDLVFVSVDLSEVTGSISTLSVNILYNEENAPAQIRISSPVFLKNGSDDFLSAGQYLASGIECTGCSFDTGTGAVVMSSSDFSIDAGYAGALSSFSGRMYFFLDFESVPGGVLTFSVVSRSYGKTDERNTDTVRIPLSPDVLNYVIPVETRGYIESYSLDFSGISPESAQLKISRIHTDSGSEPPLATSAGTLSSIRRNGSLISFSGTAERNYIRDNPDSKIVFLAFGSDGHTELGSTELTTRFDYSADLSALGLSPEICTFAAAFKSPAGDLMLMSKPRSYDPADQYHEPTAKLGISGGAAAGAFEANASHYIIDVPLDDLLSDSANNIALRYKSTDGTDSVIRLNKNIIDRIDGEIGFCSSAEIRVYLRFISATPVAGLTYPGTVSSNYGLYLPDDTGRRMYCSIVSFLAERYGSIAGFVIGRDALSAGETGVSFMSHPVGYCEALAEVCRLTYNAASAYIPDIMTLVPAGISDRTACSSFTVLFSDCVNETGCFPWTFLLVSRNFEAVPSVFDGSVKLLSAMNIPYFSDYMLYCDFDEDLLFSAQKNNVDFSDYLSAKIMESCSGSEKARAVFISLGDKSFVDDVTVFRALQGAEDSGGYVYEGNAEVLQYQADEEDGYVLWDFSNIYYNPGWISAGIDNLSSNFGRYTAVSADRVLRFDNDSAGNGIGILLGTFDRTSDLTPADSISFDIAVGSGERDETITLIFVMGTDDSRAEYYADIVPDGKFYTYTCDISDIPSMDTTDFIGLMIYSDRPYSGEMSSVRINSKTASNDELENIFLRSEENTAEEGNTRLLITATAVIVLVLTSVIAILMIRHEKEEKETQDGKARKTYGKQQ